MSALRFGSEYWHTHYRPIFNDTLINQIDNYSAAFAEASIYISKDLAAQAGLRFEHSSLIDKSDIAPRLSLPIKPASTHRYLWPMGFFIKNPRVNNYMARHEVGFTKATHYILNYQKINNQRIFRAEAYYKKYEDLVKQVPVSYNYFSYNNSGNGYAKGVGSCFSGTRKRSKTSITGSAIPISIQNGTISIIPVSLQPNFVATHTASVVTKKFFMDIKSGFNVTYSWASGRPYYNIMPDASNKFYVADQGKTKDYNSLNFSAEWVPSIGKENAKSFIVLFASVNNILGSNQVYGYNYSYSGAIKEPIHPRQNDFILSDASSAGV